MNKLIRDIRVVGPEDKLLIVVEGASPERLESLAHAAEDFMNKKENRVLVVKDMQPFIIRGGARTSLAFIFEEKIEEGGK